jgi:SAM-dependent methyltransferase
MDSSGGGYWNHNAAYHPQLVREAVSTGGPVLDVGCGDGLLPLRLALAGLSVLGLEPDPTAAALARTRCASVPGVEIRQAPFLDSDLDEGAFGFITMVAVLHHMDGRAALTRARQVLRPGGRLVVVGIPRLSSKLDYVWATSQIPRARAMDRLRSSHTPAGVPIADSDLTVAEARRLSAEVLPGSRLRRSPYYRYTLIWTKP